MNNEQNVIREPDLYDLFNSRDRDDIGMYLSLFSEAQNVLELGIGTGRVSFPLAERGIRITGVDNSEEMLTSLRNKLANAPEHISSKVKIINQDFCNLDIQDKFDFAFYPFCTFNYLLTIEQQISALESLKKHLKKGSEVIFDLMTIQTFPNILYNANQTHYDSILQGDIEINISTRSSFDQASQLFTQYRSFEYNRQNDVIFKKQIKMINRVFLLGEFQLLLEKCGYKIIKKYGSYDLLKFNSSSYCFIIIATPK